MLGPVPTVPERSKYSAACALRELRASPGGHPFMPRPSMCDRRLRRATQSNVASSLLVGVSQLGHVGCGPPLRSCRSSRRGSAARAGICQAGTTEHYHCPKGTNTRPRLPRRTSASSNPCRTHRTRSPFGSHVGDLPPVRPQKCPAPRKNPTSRRLTTPPGEEGTTLTDVFALVRQRELPRPNTNHTHIFSDP